MPKRNLFKALFLMLVVTNYAQADLAVPLDNNASNISPTSGDFTYIGTTLTKWLPGLNTAGTHAGGAGPMSPGGASWSAMPSGVGFSASVPFETVPTALAPNPPHPVLGMSTDIEFLLTAGVDNLEYTLFNSAFNVWTAAAGITNLGQVADGGTTVGASEISGGHLGDIRVAAYPYANDPPNVNTLAHAYQPFTQSLGGLGGTIGGDVHFDIDRNWVDDPNDTMAGFDFFTVALHELGHSLGLGHSTVDGSVMEAIYDGTRRTLTADDIAGIQALYGAAPAAVPEPSAFLFGCLLVTFGVVTKRKK